MYLFGKWKKIELLNDEIQNISDQSTFLNKQIQSISILEIINILDALSKIWIKDSPFYLKALDILSNELSFSKEMIMASLNIIPELLCRESLEKRLFYELGNYEHLDGPVSTQSGARLQFKPLGTILHVTAGNVFLGFLDSLIMGFITKNISIVKLSSSNQTFPKLLVESLNDIDTNRLLIDKFALLNWKGGDQSIEVALVQKVDAIIGWGGEAMLNSYSKILPFGVKLLDFGPKISFGILSEDYLQKTGMEEVCNQIALDVCMWDQAACANMQDLYVDSRIDLNLLISSLTNSFLNFKYELGDVSKDERVEILKEKSLALYDEMDTGIKSEFNSKFNLRFENHLKLRSSPLNRTLIIKKYKEIDFLVTMLSKFKPYLQTCGLGVSENQTQWINELSDSGVKRFTKLGSMLRGVNGAPHDGRYVLRDLVSCISIEFEENLDSFFKNTLKKVKYYNGVKNVNEIPLISGESLKKYPIDKTSDFLNINTKSNIIFTSGGTTGEPKYSMYSNYEFSYICELLAQSYMGLGLTENDVVANLFMAGNMWSSFMAIYKALEFCPVSQLPIGGQSEIKDIIKYVVDFKANTLFGIPSLLVELANFTKSNNIEINIKNIFYAGEKITKTQIELFKEAWNIENIYSAGYASVDVGPIGYQTKDCAINEHFLFDGLELEVINEECVISSTIRKTMPVVRYKTGDKIEILTHDEKVKFKIIGRVDDMIYIWGARVSLLQIQSALNTSLNLNNNTETAYQVSITTGIDSTDIMTISTGEEVNVSVFIDSLLNISEDMKNTVSFNKILKNLIFLKTNNFIKNSKTGKTSLLVDLR
jgi:phenylacetate-coenzyme A ligase PaaK-like adenylate-forming protein